MPVNIDNVISEVSAESEPAPAQGYTAPTAAEALEAHREAHAQLLRDRMRTAAEGFDD